MTPVEREIIAAKHAEGLMPSEIARQLEMPVRQVVQVTGTLRVKRRMTAAALRQAVGGRDFTIAEAAGLFDLDQPSAGSTIRGFEAAGLVMRVGSNRVGRAMTTVWRMRHE